MEIYFVIEYSEHHFQNRIEKTFMKFIPNTFELQNNDQYQSYIFFISILWTQRKFNLKYEAYKKCHFLNNQNPSDGIVVAYSYRSIEHRHVYVITSSLQFISGQIYTE